MDKKKTKLTISGNFKKSFKNLDNPKFPEKKSVFVNKTSKPKLKGFSNKQSNFKSSSLNQKKKFFK